MVLTTSANAIEFRMSSVVTTGRITSCPTNVPLNDCAMKSPIPNSPRAIANPQPRTIPVRAPRNPMIRV